MEAPIAASSPAGFPTASPESLPGWHGGRDRRPVGTAMRFCRTKRERRALANLAHGHCAWTLPDAREPSQSRSPSMQRALGALPASFRQAVELVDVADMSYRDAAAIIGVPLGTVMSRLHR